ncbi:MAG: DTW domain-containing protein [Xanthomonadaceae bacterium]|nr:DTW domain-containing protein [Xanthomonadaceae bacterium]
MSAQRDLCLSCFRAKRICYCGEIRPITPQTQFVILRHKLERKRSIGTAQMTRLSLTNSLLITDDHFEDHPEIIRILESHSFNKYVLFPGPSSITIDTTALPNDQPRIVFVIDGTWLDAKQILRMNPKIAAIQKISFLPGRLSEYGFRKQPAPHCLSTIESIHHVLNLTEPSLNSESLLHVFKHMVKIQIDYAYVNKLPPVL